MELFIDPRSPLSLPTQIFEQLRGAITDGVLAPGSRLQPTRQVAQTLGVARSTVTEAYARLVAEGYVEGRRGGGSVVADCPVSRPPEEGDSSALAPTEVVATLRLYGQGDPRPALFDLTAGRVDPSLFPAEPWRRSLADTVAGSGGAWRPWGGTGIRPGRGG